MPCSRAFLPLNLSLYNLFRSSQKSKPVLTVGNIPQACGLGLYASLVQKSHFFIRVFHWRFWMTKFKLSSSATPCSFFLLVTPFWRLQFSHFAAAGSTHSSTRILGWKPSAQCMPVPSSTGGTPTTKCLRPWARQRTSSAGPGVDSCQVTALQAARRNLGWTPGLQINSWPSAFPFMTQLFFMKGFTVCEEQEARRSERRNSRGKLRRWLVIEIKVQRKLLKAAAAL